MNLGSDNILNLFNENNEITHIKCLCGLIKIVSSDNEIVLMLHGFNSCDQVLEVHDVGKYALINNLEDNKNEMIIILNHP